MYNENQKLEYLNDCDYENTTIEVIKSLFNTIEVSENLYETDVCNFNRVQIIDMLKGINSKSRSRLRVVVAYLSNYYNWCKEKNYVENHTSINEYDKDMLFGVIEDILPIKHIKKAFFTKEEMLEYLPEILDISNRFVAYALFCGVRGDDYEELRMLKMSDLDEETKILKLSTGRSIKIDDLFYNLMWRTNVEENYYPDGIERNKIFGAYTYIENGFVLKACRVGEMGVAVSRTVIINRLKLIKQQTENPFITATTLYKSGLVNYIKEKFIERGISLYDAFFKQSGRVYIYSEELDKYIKEYGSNITSRMLRTEIKEYIELL